MCTGNVLCSEKKKKKKQISVDAACNGGGAAQMLYIDKSQVGLKLGLYSVCYNCCNVLV